MALGKRYNNLFIPKLYNNVYLTSAQILALFTTPITVVPAVSGMVIIPTRVHAAKEAGTAYTLGAAVRLQVVYKDIATNFPASSMDLASFLNSSSQRSQLAFGPGSSSQLYPYIDIYNAAVDSQALVAIITGGNPTVGTGGIFLNIVYELWPQVIPW